MAPALATFAANVGVAFVAAAAFIAAGFGRNKAEHGDEFDPYRAAATVLLAEVLAVLATLAGIPVTQEFIMTQIPAYMGVIYLVQKVLRAAVATFDGGVPTGRSPPRK